MTKTCACCGAKFDKQFGFKYQPGNKWLCDYCDLDETDITDDGKQQFVVIDGKTYSRPRYGIEKGEL